MRTSDNSAIQVNRRSRLAPALLRGWVLEDRQLVPEIRLAVLGREGGRQSAEPLAKERLDVPGAEAIADRLKRLRVVAGEEAVVESLVPDPLVRELPLGPPVAVERSLAKTSCREFRSPGALSGEVRERSVREAILRAPIPTDGVVVGERWRVWWPRSDPSGHRLREVSYVGGATNDDRDVAGAKLGVAVEAGDQLSVGSS